VSCSAGSAVCEVEKGTKVADLVRAIVKAGYDARASN